MSSQGGDEASLKGELMGDTETLEYKNGAKGKDDKFLTTRIKET